MFPTSPPRMCNATSFTFHFAAAVGLFHSSSPRLFSRDSSSRLTSPNNSPVKIGCTVRNGSSFLTQTEPVLLADVPLRRLLDDVPIAGSNRRRGSEFSARPPLALGRPYEPPGYLINPLQVFRLHHHRSQARHRPAAAFRGQVAEELRGQLRNGEVQSLPGRLFKDPPRLGRNLLRRATARHEAQDIQL